jgi:hypothetical protein
MESTATFNVSTIVPKKLKLSDYEMGQTLGTGNLNLLHIYI